MMTFLPEILALVAAAGGYTVYRFKKIETEVRALRERVADLKVRENSKGFTRG